MKSVSKCASDVEEYHIQPAPHRFASRGRTSPIRPELRIIGRPGRPTPNAFSSVPVSWRCSAKGEYVISGIGLRTAQQKQQPGEKGREAERKLVSGKRTDTKRSVEQNRMLSRVSKLSI